MIREPEPVATATWNPYLEEVRRLPRGFVTWMDADEYSFFARDYRTDPRGPLVKKYSWSIPSEEALALIAEHAPGGVTEVMAGTGYWARCLRERGVDVVAMDEWPPDGRSHKDAEGRVVGGNHWHDGASCWTPVGRRDAVEAAAAADPSRTLLMSWPPYGDHHAARALRAFRGSAFIYVGETMHGCCGSPRLFLLLEKRWRQVAEVRLPQWWGMHDRLLVFKRAEATT